MTSDTTTDCCASNAARLLSSSLYLTAALHVYLTLTSLLASAAEPPCDWKYFVADSLPPTFITRSCSHCHSRLITNNQPLSSSSQHLPRDMFHTIEVGRANKGDMDTEVPVVGRTIETQVNAERHG